jgi:large conductance mechanosensitive channel
MLKGFREFILRGNVVDLAVGVVIGAAFNSVVESLVKNILTPLIGAIARVPDFSSLFFTFHHSRFLYGAFLNSFISFVLVAAAVYFFVVVPVNTLFGDHKKAIAPTTKLCGECRSDIPLDATRCKFCAQSVS